MRNRLANWDVLPASQMEFATVDRAFKIIGALGLSISAGVLLGKTTPTAMKDAPEPGWRVAARSANAGKPIDLSQPAVVYSSLPEDLSPQIGYGSPAAYQADYVDAPVRTGYSDVPRYSPKPLAAAPVQAPADAPASQPATQASPDPDTAAAEGEHTLVFETASNAPAMGASGED